MTEVLVNNKQKERGQASIALAIISFFVLEECLPEDKFNRYKVCEKVAEIMESKYEGEKLEYHSTRMGMETTQKILKEVDAYFYKDFK